MKFKILAEYVIYALVAVGMALWVRDRGLPPGSTPQRRTPAEAAALRSALGIPGHVPAVVEFFDFQCPPCRMTYPSIKAILGKHPNVLYRPVNFPLPIHQYAYGAAVASEVANGDLRVVDDLFTGKSALDPSSLNAYLKKKSLPGVVGTSTAGAYRARVDSDIALGKRMRVQGTPTIFVLSGSGELTEVHGAGQIESAF